VNQRKPIIGLAGGIGAGKTSVAESFARQGAKVFDADAVAQAVLDREQIRDVLVDWWGKQILDERGHVDRRRVAERVFNDQAQRKRLESLIHPIVAARRNEMIEQAQADPAVRAIVLDVPLLFEVGLDKLCDRVIFVRADRADRLARLAETRGWGAEELDRREKNQWPLDKKLQFAHDIIDNDNGEADRDAQVRSLLERILETKS